jgi:rhodanese-related sulfurtransferase
MKHLSPKEAWAWLQAVRAQRDVVGLEGPLFVDVRMEIESLYVGRPPGVENIPWYEYPDLTPDPVRFAAAVEKEAGAKDRPVLLICRSGKRTLDAGAALEAAGFSEVAHVVHGFEGDLSEAFKRSCINGWRFDGLPWEQM